MADEDAYNALADAFFGADAGVPVVETNDKPLSQNSQPPGDSDIFSELLSEDKFEELLQNLPDWRSELAVESRARIIEKM